MLKIEDLYFKYSRSAGDYVLKDVNFSAARSEICAVIGPNGGGKSTLLKCAAGVLKPARGKMICDGACLFSAAAEDRARSSAYMPQAQIPPSCGVFDAVLLGRKPHINFRPSAKDIARAEEAIKLTGISHIAGKRCDELSGGELQKVVLARAVAQEPKILLLDEPTNHLDLRNQTGMMKLIKELTIKLNMITVAVIHDINLAIRYGDRFVMVKNGEIFKNSNISAITKENIDSLYSVDSKIREIDGEKIVLIN